jgi:aconitate hydratase
VKNLLAPGIAPGSTVHAGTGEQLPLWRAAQRHASEGASFVVVAGARCGMGSSRELGGPRASLCHRGFRN